MGALLAGSARWFADRTAIRFAHRELSFTSLYERACAFANVLRDDGIGRGDVVAIHLPNCPRYAIAYYGILLSGAVFSPTDPLLPPGRPGRTARRPRSRRRTDLGPAAPELAAVRDRTAIRLVLVTDREHPLDPAHRVGVEGMQDFEALHADAPTTAPDVEIDVRHDLAHRAHTGGTTGRSKGVQQLPHRDVVVGTLQHACWGTGSVPGARRRGRRGARPDRAGERVPDAPGRRSTCCRGSTPWARSER